MRPTLLVILSACTITACVGAPPPPPGHDDGSSSSAADPSTTTSLGPTSSADTVGTVDGTGLDTGSGATTVGVSATDGSATTDGTTMGVEPTTSGSSSGGSECETWGPGNYDYCLTELGTFDSAGFCGAVGSCINSGSPIETVVCGQSCNALCDCPAPPATGTATVTCADIVSLDGFRECYLSCENGETCPDGMVCRDGMFCTHPVQPLAMYGDCGAVASGCADGGTCAVGVNGATTWMVCIDACVNLGECDPAPAGALGQACAQVYPDVAGNECHLDCNDNSDCPSGMDCIDFGMGYGNFCMWSQ